LQLHNCLVHTLFIFKSDPNTEKWWFLGVEKGCRTGQKRWRQQRLFSRTTNFSGNGQWHSSLLLVMMTTMLVVVVTIVVNVMLVTTMIMDHLLLLLTAS